MRTLRRFSFALFFLLCLAMPAQSQSLPLGDFQAASDIGAVRRAGSSAFDPDQQTFRLSGSGENMWFAADEGQFVWRKMQGNVILDARTVWETSGGDPHRKAGLMIRESLAPDAAHVSAVVHGDGLTSLQYRRTAGVSTEEVRSTATGADVLRIERAGDRFIISAARFGEVFQTDTLDGIKLPDSVYVGLFVSAHDADAFETAMFDNVRLTVPAAPDFVPYQDYIGSRLEVLDLNSGRRRVIYESPDGIEAPNWTRDGEALIFNKGGSLYRFDLDKGTPEKIPTGAANRNNNDHVLSFDGNWVGLSHHSDGPGGGSRVYVVPIEGGEPRLVTPRAPSYLHGWSPDDQFLVYTAERGDGNYDIYRIPAAGGKEERLTTEAGLDDGPEYTPDGKSILFNSVRSGLMQLWRMDADGSDQRALTEDGFNNWFAHPSPDGSRIVFLSFGTDVDPSDHPYYKRVLLREMPGSGGAPRVVAYLYGGQGTINVPSWSPDGRFVAFVSNTGSLGHR